MSTEVVEHNIEAPKAPVTEKPKRRSRRIAKKNPEKIEKPVKEKKPRTEKQKAAFEKARKTLLANREKAKKRVLDPVPIKA